MHSTTILSTVIAAIDMFATIPPNAQPSGQTQIAASTIRRHAQFRMDGLSLFPARRLAEKSVLQTAICAQTQSKPPARRTAATQQLDGGRVALSKGFSTSLLEFYYNLSSPYELGPDDLQRNSGLSNQCK
ncbi:hypothetical protein GT037_010369 [Alternaria burnsii]|uniref:Uncharacterized protein n=1 Tax=Alternaria burnsii TaxID=1187904 RepID=A0A8H7AUJ0_9PLEO|nr:uncharacterized protein GT037_010369 [Alternaria burnsii]KAF7671557.1 hypothetical protein GT037_010369 [Alternaria burnsii]